MLEINFSNLSSMCSLMEKYGDSEFPFSGENEEGEMVEISIFPDRIVSKIYQSNGWVRLDTLWEDGTIEQTFDGKWE